MKMPFPENSFDAVYAIEATCHAPDAVCCAAAFSHLLKSDIYYAHSICNISFLLDKRLDAINKYIEC